MLSNGLGNVIANGVETVTHQHPHTVNTSAFTQNNLNLVENYVCRAPATTSSRSTKLGYTTQVDLTAGGSDFPTLNDTSATFLPGVDLSTR